MRLLSSSSIIFALGLAPGCAQGTQLSGTEGTQGAGAGGASTTGETGGAGGATTTGGGQSQTTGSGTGGAGGGAGGEAASGGGGAGGAGGEAGQGGSPQGGGGTGGQTTGTGVGGGPVHLCGDGVVAPDEECDGPNLDGQTCESLGFVGGILSCSSECTLDVSQCTNCGNGTVEPALGEECDFDANGNPLVLTTCAGLGFAGSSANPGCDPTCHYDTTPCLCGNGAVDPGEDCDGADFDGKTCMTFGFAGGMLLCNSSCEILATGCTQCGNGVIDGQEECDGAAFGGKTCMTFGFSGGTLTCNPGCGIVTSGCTKCGNGVLEAGEQCDDGNVASGDGCSAMCQTEVLACNPDGTYFVMQGGPISYSCCFGLVSVNVSSFIFMSDGATILSSPSSPVPMTGSATTCPAGSFSNAGTLPGGCAESYSLTGSFTGPNTWSGLYSMSFTGPDCSCFGGIGTPCIGQVFSITAMR